MGETVQGGKGKGGRGKALVTADVFICQGICKGIRSQNDLYFKAFRKTILTTNVPSIMTLLMPTA